MSRSRPTVSVVMPFGGDVSAAASAISALQALAVRPGDELILADNTGMLEAGVSRGVRVVPAPGERSPARARNAGARVAAGEWLLFIDSDCRAPRELLDVFFDPPPDDEIGALAGQVVPAGEPATLAERYGAARSFLDQRSHLTHPYMPRAAAANLLVRRRAFEQLGGFLEGLRAGEDTDFSWRLQAAGWRLELRERARVEHRYRSGLGELRAQWRGYAAGRAWLSRRHPGFHPQPALWRALRRVTGRRPRQPEPILTDPLDAPAAPAASAASAEAGAPSARERLQFLAIDGLLAAEELAGLLLGNRPSAADRRAPARPTSLPWARGSQRLVLVAERFPVDGDPLVELAGAVTGSRVEAARRPEGPPDPRPSPPVTYREDDGALRRWGSLALLVAIRPARCAADRTAQRPDDPPLRELAPSALRLLRLPPARLAALGGPVARRTAERLAALSGVPLAGVPDAGRARGAGGSGRGRQP